MSRITIDAAVPSIRQDAERGIVGLAIVSCAMPAHDKIAPRPVLMTRDTARRKPRLRMPANETRYVRRYRQIPASGLLDIPYGVHCILELLRAPSAAIRCASALLPLSPALSGSCECRPPGRRFGLNLTRAQIGMLRVKE